VSESDGEKGLAGATKRQKKGGACQTHFLFPGHRQTEQKPRAKLKLQWSSASVMEDIRRAPRNIVRQVEPLLLPFEQCPTLFAPLPPSLLDLLLGEYAVCFCAQCIGSCGECVGRGIRVCMSIVLPQSLVLSSLSAPSRYVCVLYGVCVCVCVWVGGPSLAPPHSSIARAMARPAATRAVAM